MMANINLQSVLNEHPEPDAEGLERAARLRVIVRVQPKMKPTP